MRSVLLIVLLSCLSLTSFAGELNTGFNESGEVDIFGIVAFNGEIVPGDAERILEFVSNYPNARIQTFNLSSPGGDVAEAMRIGQIFRDHDVGVHVSDGGCFSSCVLILAGAVERSYYPRWQPNPVGVHRPYFAEHIDGDAVSDEYTQMRDAVDQYAKRMNLSADLVEMMFSVEPVDMNILSAAQVRKYFPARDPAFEAKVVNMDAELIGISPAEYRKREAYAARECRDSDYICKQAVLIGVSRMDYEEWREECSAWASKNDPLGSAFDPYTGRLRCEIAKPWEH